MTIHTLPDTVQRQPFASRESQALRHILRTAASLEHAIDEALKPYGLTRTQYNVLYTLDAAGDAGLYGREIGERLECPVPDVPRLLERMADAGLIRRERDAVDRRLVTAQLTNVGRQLLAAATPVLEAGMQHWASGLSAEELQMVNDALDTVQRAL